MIQPLEPFEELLPAHLATQRWYAGESEPADVTVRASEDWDDLLWALVDADGVTYQLVLCAEQGFEGSERHVVGTVDGVTVLDALAHPPAAVQFVERVCGETVSHARLFAGVQSNSSVVGDERVVVKLFRQVHEGPNPDVEVTSALAGFEHVPEVLGVLRREGTDLAVGSEFLARAVDGWPLALTSLRDLLASDDDLEPPDPADAGGDFGYDANRLGGVVAHLHSALADAFGRQGADLDAWVQAMRTQLERTARDIGEDLVPVEALGHLYDRVSQLDEAGSAIRIHGDLHLGQTLLDDHWYVIDFEGEPARPSAERTQRSSPLRDVAGMVRSLHYAAAVGVREHGRGDVADRAAEAWRARAVERFLDGYFEHADPALLPVGDEQRQLLLDAFLADKAVYEAAYEASYRPDWLTIPLSALQRILRT